MEFLTIVTQSVIVLVSVSLGALIGIGAAGTKK